MYSVCDTGKIWICRWRHFGTCHFIVVCLFYVKFKNLLIKIMVKLFWQFNFWLTYITTDWMVDLIFDLHLRSPLHERPCWDDIALLIIGLAKPPHRFKVKTTRWGRFNVHSWIFKVIGITSWIYQGSVWLLIHIHYRQKKHYSIYTEI